MTLIVGSGLAGWRLAQALDAAWARTGNREPLVVLGEEPGPFDRMALGEWATGLREPWPGLNQGWNRPESRFEARTVVSLDLQARTLTDDRGQGWTWDRLVLATGAEPVIPELFQGCPQAVAVSSVEGARQIRSWVRPARILVVGGGPLGLETAWNLNQAGHQVTLSHRGNRLLAPFVDELASRAVLGQWEAQGIRVLLGSAESDRDQQGDELQVSLTSGIWKGDLAVLACGTQPRTVLARAAGLRVSEAGIEVDANGQTSDPTVWALGDCAAPGSGRPAGLWAPARDAVDRLVAHWTNGAAPTAAPSFPTFRLKTPWIVAAQGSPDSVGTTTSVVTPEGHWSAVVGPTGLAHWQVVGTVADAERRIADLEAGQVRLDLPATGGAWPDSQRICDCHGVTAGTLRQLGRAGTRNLDEVGRLTGAGTSCGTCRGRIAVLQAEGHLRPTLTQRWTLWLSRPRRKIGSVDQAFQALVSYTMLVSGLLTGVTGILKMPGWLEAWGVNQRDLPDDLNEALSALLDLHDVPGLVFVAAALVHVALHGRALVNYVRAWFRRD